LSLYTVAVILTDGMIGEEGSYYRYSSAEYHAKKVSRMFPTMLVTLTDHRLGKVKRYRYGRITKQ